MHLKIHYLAQVKHAAGVASEHVELPSGATVVDVIRRLAEKHGDALRRLLLTEAGELNESILLFVGDEQTSWDSRRVLEEGDAISVLSPMAGG